MGFGTKGLHHLPKCLPLSSPKPVHSHACPSGLLPFQALSVSSPATFESCGQWFHWAGAGGGGSPFFWVSLVSACGSVLPGPCFTLCPSRQPPWFCHTRFGSSSSELKCVFFCLTCKLGFQIFASSRLSCSCHCKLECFVLVCRLLEDVRELKLRAVLCLVTQLCPTLCDAMNCSPPGSSVHGILQARILELVVIPFSRGSSWPRDQTWVSCTAGRFFTVWGTRGIPKSEEFD